MNQQGIIISSEFKAAWWLANPHLQTIWGGLARRTEKLRYQRERIELPDGDFVDIDWINPTVLIENQPILIILHGLGGSIQSHYAQGILSAILRQGWRAMFMHFRGASGIPNRLARSYHSGDTNDINYVAKLLRIREPDAPLLAVGYSLGGNVLLKWLAETGNENPVSAAVAVSVPFELHNAATRLTEGFSQFYQWVLLRNLRTSLINKFKIVKAPIETHVINEAKTFWQFDTLVTAPLHGFLDARHYYDTSSSRPFLKDIKKPTLIIHALDDPFMTAACIPAAHELSPTIQLELSEQGGHVGFISGQVPGRPEYWLDQRIIRYFERHFG